MNPCRLKVLLTVLKLTLIFSFKIICWITSEQRPLVFNLSSTILFLIRQAVSWGWLLGLDDLVDSSEKLPCGALLTHLQTVLGLKPKYLAVCLMLWPFLTIITALTRTLGK